MCAATTATHRRRGAVTIYLVSIKRFVVLVVVQVDVTVGGLPGPAGLGLLGLLDLVDLLAGG